MGASNQLDQETSLCTDSAMLHNQYGTREKELELNAKSENDQQQSSQQNKGTSLMQFTALCVIMLFVFFTSIGSAAIQILGKAIPEFELLVWRFAFQFLIVLPFNAYQKFDIKIPRHKIWILAVNIFLTITQIICLILSMEYLPAGTASGLSEGLVVVIGALLLLCMKSEEKTWMVVGSVACVIGMMLMLQPPFLFGLQERREVNWTSPCLETDMVKSVENAINNLTTFSIKNLTNEKAKSNITYFNVDDNTVSYSYNGDEDFNLYNDEAYFSFSSSLFGWVLCLGHAVFYVGYTYSLCYIVDEISTVTFMFWNTLIGCIISIMISFSFENVSIPSSPFCWFLLFCHCIGTVTLVVPWCVKYVSPNVCNLMIGNKLVILTIMQYTVLRDIKPGLENWVEVLDTVVCFIGVIKGTMGNMFVDVK